ncbi:hypothetical protein DJ013_05710 [Arcticibacterium luteifluviistationis]|uniref:Uncharacterized protein n=1 Tax=Arcticibacterium luteifluviistationis TaxID=1784714 RepID=A0A2Z4G8Y9_9BACT|nr:hypothetical protein DJ013_05710 [Arcticibacterium luteifluviistationis]
MLTFFLEIHIKLTNKSMMKNLFKLEPGLPAESAIKIIYYFLLSLSVITGIGLIVEGLNDPFGELFIVLGILVLLIIPIVLRIVFGLIIRNK